MVRFQQAVIQIRIKVNRNWIFDNGGQFFAKAFYKLRYPVASIIVVAIRDEDVVFVSLNQRRHSEQLKDEDLNR